MTKEHKYQVEWFHFHVHVEIGLHKLAELNLIWHLHRSED